MRLNRTVDKRHGEQAAPRTDGHEELRKLAARRVTAADHDRLECESRQQESLEPGRLRHQARQASTSRSNAGPPRIGSATGRRIDSDARVIAASASTVDSVAVLKLTPAQRIFGFVSEPIRRCSAIASCERRRRKVRIAEQAIAARLVAEHDDVRLAAVQEPERDAGIGGMKQRALALDHVPVVGRRIRAQDFRGARDEVGDHRVHRHAAAGDHDPGLPGGAEIRVDAAAAQCPRDRERRVFLAERAVRADGEQALAGALAAGADRDVRGRLADVDEPPAEPLGRRLELARGGELAVHAGDDVEARLEGLDKARNPVRLQYAAGVGDADDERARAACMRLLRREPRQAGCDRRSGHRELADAEVPRPVTQAERGLRVAGVGDVAEKQQVAASAAPARSPPLEARGGRSCVAPARPAPIRMRVRH